LEITIFCSGGGEELDLKDGFKQFPRELAHFPPSLTQLTKKKNIFQFTKENNLLNLSNSNTVKTNEFINRKQLFDQTSQQRSISNNCKSASE
jgi:hypothetical protein